MEKVTVPSLKAMKSAGRRIAALTCYDFTTARLLNEAGIDLILVGDSLGMVKLGYDSTLPVTVEDMVYHTRLVARGNSRALLVTDMPYLSYHASPEEAVRNSGRMLKAGAQAVKIEGGAEMAPVLRALQTAKIPVLGHLGMTPQSIHQFGGFKVQGREAAARRKLRRDAKTLERLGAFAVVLECIPEALGLSLSRALKIPTIGIGAGPHCDGQVIVADDMLGFTPAPRPRFVKAYADLRGTILKAARRYAEDVRARRFPDEAHSYHG